MVLRHCQLPTPRAYTDRECLHSLAELVNLLAGQLLAQGMCDGFLWKFGEQTVKNRAYVWKGSRFPLG